MTRRRPAPIDMRTAISRWRDAERASSRLATLAHHDQQHQRGDRHQNRERAGQLAANLRQAGSRRRQFQRAVLDEEFVVGGLLDGAGDSLPVLGAENESAQDEEVERSLQEFAAFRFLGRNFT